ncbi:unnamed protein product [Cyprideis torosa]|uniref:Uncharacterized protein n=1 Tax=Cyprideis torosa TaxID=163714 RepID=A0A7R8WMF5_9CRUS|nr:unnamed protein product [Cyprideis torosa]CAG0902694.1 unnamed protein product [Cyprideis torosa]
MLTGLLPPTSGTAFINGYDICTNIASVRSSLGLCQQHDVLMEQLTLKGFGNEEIEQDTLRLLDSVGMEEKRDAMPSSLSGGMKRKLSILISFCGFSKILIMDEPTAAVDPGSRRAIWELILNKRDGRTTLITTHFMDEADYLGDRIAVLADGEVQCCGSSLFLKKKLEVGYELVIEKETGASTSKITRFIQRVIEGAFLQQDVGVDLIYVLPSHTSAEFPTVVNEYLKSTRTICCYKFLQQLWSQLVKNCMYIWKNWILMAIVISLPAVYMLLQMLLLQAQPGSYVSPSRTFALSEYWEPITTVAYTSLAATASKVAKAFKQFSIEDGSAIKEVPDGTSVDTFFADKARCLIKRTGRTLKEIIEDQLGTKKDGNDVQIVQGIAAGLSFSLTFLGMGLLSERFSKAKHLQIVSGLRIWIYWLGVFIVQYCVYLVSITLVIVTFHVHRDYQQLVRLSGEIFVVLTAQGFMVLPYMYFFTLHVNSVEIGFIVILLILLFPAVVVPPLMKMVLLLLTSIVDTEVLDPLQEVVNVVLYLVTPPYAMIKSMENLALNDDRNHAHCPETTGAASSGVQPLKTVITEPRAAVHREENISRITSHSKLPGLDVRYFP